MSFQPASDVLSDLLVEKVPGDVRATMSEEQLKAVRYAAGRKHALDVRFTVPLLFTQLYFVFLVGKDTRTETVVVRHERRSETNRYAEVWALALLSGLAVMTAVVVLYVLKSRAGIDLFPGHARDYVPVVK